MREILFKAKRLDNGKWAEGYPVYDRADCTLKRQGKCQCAHDGSLITFFGWIDNLHEYDEVEVDPSTVCEYTGITDKNGMKIFEGDIIHWANWNGEQKESPVCYDQEWNRFCVWLNGAESMGVNIHLSTSGIEVIGSIHDGEGYDDD